MKDIEIRDLIDLVVADVDDGDARIQKIFEWHFERVKTVSQWVVVVAGGLLVSLLVEFLTGDMSIHWAYTLLSALAAVATATFGVYYFARLRSMRRQFVVALGLYRQLRDMRPFIVLYLAIVRRTRP